MATATTKPRKNQVWTFNGECLRILSAGAKAGIRAQRRQGMRGRFSSEVETISEADLNGWTLRSGPGSEQDED